jgi:hypothetical protein
MSGCASAQGASPDAPTAEVPAPAESIRLDVENTNALDATLYVLGDSGIPRRLGDVPGNGGMRSFDVPWTFAVDMALRIDLVAGGSCLTVPTLVGPGEAMDVRILARFTPVDCQ